MDQGGFGGFDQDVGVSGICILCLKVVTFQVMICKFCNLMFLLIVKNYW